MQLRAIDLFIIRHKVVHNGGSPNFKGLLFGKKTTYLTQILQSLSYNVCSIILPKFTTFGLFIPILDTPAIMDQTACCYNVTTSKTGLFVVKSVQSALSDLLSTSATHGTFSRPSTKPGLILIGLELNTNARESFEHC